MLISFLPEATTISSNIRLYFPIPFNWFNLEENDLYNFILKLNFFSHTATLEALNFLFFEF